MENIEKKSTIEIVNEMTKLDQEIELKMLKKEKLKKELKKLNEELNQNIPKYKKLRLEIVRRFPGLENSKEFKEGFAWKKQQKNSKNF